MQTNVTTNTVMTHRLAGPTDFRGYDAFVVQASRMSEGNTSANEATVTASAFLVDDLGNRLVGEAYPLSGRWQGVAVDLKAGDGQGVAIERIVAIGVEFHVFMGLGGMPVSPIKVETDAWALRSSYHAYVGQRLGLPNTFYAERHGSKLQVGVVNRFNIAFRDSAAVASADGSGGARSFLEISQGAQERAVLGQAGTGLFVLDQDQYDAVVGAPNPPTSDGQTRPSPPRIPPVDTPSLPPNAGVFWHTWPGRAPATFSCSLAWSSPVAALVEVRQTCWPFDRLGRPALVVTWRFMIYQTGQVFVTLTWQKSPDADVSVPVTVALVLEGAGSAGTGEAEELLKQIYPAAVRGRVLPHEYQVGHAVALFAKTWSAGEENLFWHGEMGGGRVFGIGLTEKQRGGPISCLLLANAPTVLDQAMAFSQYLEPPTLVMKTGALDRTFPGDLDNTGLVDTYGFMPIRMRDGRASFTLDPGNRPAFYPCFLFTLPAAENGQSDLSRYNLLLNVDGQQFTNPPRWLDGSFLLQLPWIIHKPVHVEAMLVPK